MKWTKTFRFFFLYTLINSAEDYIIISNHNIKHIYIIYNKKIIILCIYKHVINNHIIKYMYSSKSLFVKVLILLSTGIICVIMIKYTTVNE